LSNWLQLLDRILQGLAELARQGQPVPDWVLGGGTALMIFADHRLSRDIDAFIDDPQYLALLSPETTDVWKCSAWDRAYPRRASGLTLAELQISETRRLPQPSG
jgi:hypothetical protein